MRGNENYLAQRRASRSDGEAPLAAVQRLWPSKVQDMATAVLDDKEAVQQPERLRRHREKNYRGDVVFVEDHRDNQLTGGRR